LADLCCLIGVTAKENGRPGMSADAAIDSGVIKGLCDEGSVV
jgi:hypothetical protein